MAGGTEKDTQPLAFRSDTVFACCRSACAPSTRVRTVKVPGSSTSSETATAMSLPRTPGSGLEGRYSQLVASGAVNADSQFVINSRSGVVTAAALWERRTHPCP